MKNDARRLSVVLIIGLVLVNAVTAWLAFKTSDELKVAGTSIERAHAAYAQIDALRTRLLDIESRHQAFVNHPEDAARRQYERAVVDAWDQLQTMQRLTSDDDRQEDRLHELELVLRRHLMDLDAQVRSAEATPDPRRLQAVEAMSNSLWDLIRGEQKTLDTRWVVLTDARVRNTRHAVLTALLAILSLVSAAALIVRHLRGRERAEQALRERSQ